MLDNYCQSGTNFLTQVVFVLRSRSIGYLNCVLRGFFVLLSNFVLIYFYHLPSSFPLKAGKLCHIMQLLPCICLQTKLHYILLKHQLLNWYPWLVLHWSSWPFLVQTYHLCTPVHLCVPLTRYSCQTKTTLDILSHSTPLPALCSHQHPIWWNPPCLWTSLLLWRTPVWDFYSVHTTERRRTWLQDSYPVRPLGWSLNRLLRFQHHLHLNLNWIQMNCC